MLFFIDVKGEQKKCDILGYSMIGKKWDKKEEVRLFLRVESDSQKMTYKLINGM